MHATPTARDFFCPNFYPSGPFACIFFQKPIPSFFPVLAVTNTGCCVGPQNKIGHPAPRFRQSMQAPMLSARGVLICSKTYYVSGLAFRNCEYNFDFPKETGVFY